MITPAHFSRVKALLDNTNGEIVYGGGTIEDKKFIEPTLVVGVKEDDSLMSEYVYF
jgi:aldehyde dehydrogenase (NAD+)